LDNSSFEKLLDHIEEYDLPPNSVIRSIHVDGLPITTNSLKEDSSGIFKEMENRDKVEIVTGTIHEIALDSISEAMDYLDRVETATPSLAAGFQISPGPEAFESLRELYEGFYWLTLLMDKLETNFHLSLDDISIQGMPAREHHQKFISILKQLIDSQERGDFVLVADLLEYEVLPQAPIWKEMFGIMLDKLDVAQ
jgi:hypothetical protein